ncbi:hypothetical protein SAMN05428962_4388 [Paenibacillus sp. BC26]|nr:hypothetical protein SAMN05428962_4388 [Paenibacillus sp. BC26]
MRIVDGYMFYREQPEGWTLVEANASRRISSLGLSANVAVIAAFPYHTRVFQSFVA